MKFCIDCKRMNHHNLCDVPIDNEGVKDVVVGTPLKCAQPPWLMRCNEAYCGGEGKWFESASPRRLEVQILEDGKGMAGFKVETDLSDFEIMELLGR